MGNRKGGNKGKRHNSSTKKQSSLAEVVDAETRAENRQPVVEQAEEAVPKKSITAAWVSAGANCAMVAVSLAGLIAVGYQIREQRQSIEVSNRPWVWVADSKVTKLSPDGLSFELAVTNSGQSPAMDLTIRAIGMVSNNKPGDPEGFERLLFYSEVERFWYGESISPGQKIIVTPTFKKGPDDALIAEVLAAKRTLSVTVYFLYGDQFGSSTKEHAICLYYDPARKIMSTCRETKKNRERRMALGGAHGAPETN